MQNGSLDIGRSDWPSNCAQIIAERGSAIVQSGRKITSGTLVELYLQFDFKYLIV